MSQICPVLGFGSGGAAAATGAVRFDGSTYMERGADLNGNADSTVASYSFWYRYDDDQNDNDTTNIFECDSNKFKFVNAAGGIAIEGRRASPSTRPLDVKISTDHNDTTNWHHACGNLSTVAAASCALFVDDALSEAYLFGDFDSNTIDFTQTDHTFGAKQNGIDPVVMSFYDFWLDLGVWTDMENVTNRRKFIDGSGAPVDIGADGSTPTGSAPIVCFRGGAATFGTNVGTGGAFSVSAGALIETGAPTVAGSP
tara:strand:- start:304 stop:1068 length:765 start_codon:yes stop_codon:yes gene_type:complete